MDENALRLDPELRVCLAHMRRAPLDYRLRVRAAELLIRLGELDAGLRILRSCIDYFTLGGFPLRALWSIKLLESLDVDATWVDRAYALLTRHYARTPSSQWGDPIFEMPTPAPTAADLAALPATFPEVVAEVDRRANDIIRGANFPERLPRLPLLSDLPAGPFEAAARAMMLRRAADGDVLLAEGEVGRSVYLIAWGEARVTRRRGDEVAILGRLGEGEVFGEMALVTDSPRIASVLADGPAEILELDRGVLEGLGPAVRSLQDALSRQVCDRMVGNLMRLSPLFHGLDADRRGALIARFQSRLAIEDEVIITEGEGSPGLFIILDGLVEVTVARGGSPRTVGTLREGDVFGEISLVQDRPATASCIAARRCLLMWLPREAFAELRLVYPEVIDAISDVGEYRLLDNLYTLA
ncbi:MAG: cyclic nucleotide-binding domain-containing protein [bacterium]